MSFILARLLLRDRWTVRAHLFLDVPKQLFLMSSTYAFFVGCDDPTADLPYGGHNGPGQVANSTHIPGKVLVKRMNTQ